MIVWVDDMWGNDHNDGSRLSPVRTLQRAADLIIEGGEIILEPGEYAPPETEKTFQLTGAHGAVVTLGDYQVEVR
jgi:hypothetical protein